jgi:phage shock protein A
MAIIARIVEIFKADIHGVMDQLEDQGLLLKQHLRDMAEALHRRETKLRKMRVSHNQGLKDLAGYKQQWEDLHKTRLQRWEKDVIDPVFDGGYGEPADQEIELELLKRKEALEAPICHKYSQLV